MRCSSRRPPRVLHFPLERPVALLGHHLPMDAAVRRLPGAARPATTRHTGARRREQVEVRRIVFVLL